MESIKSKTIHIPSVFRLLRLLHATMCEMGEECCAYDLEKHKPSPLLSIHRKPSSSCVLHLPFGLALCHACVEALSGRVGFEASDPQRAILEQVETHPQRTVSTRLLCATHVERVTNENVGSLVLYKHVKRISSSHAAASDVVKKRKQLLEDLIVQKQNSITEKDKMLSQGYVTAFDFAMEQFDAHVGRKRNVAIAIEQAKVAKRVTRKKELSLPIYNKIEELLTGFTYKEMVLSGSWNHAGYLFTFRNWYVRVYYIHTMYTIKETTFAVFFCFVILLQFSTPTTAYYLSTRSAYITYYKAEQDGLGIAFVSSKFGFN